MKATLPVRSTVSACTEMLSMFSPSLALGAAVLASSASLPERLPCKRHLSAKSVTR